MPIEEILKCRWCHGSKVECNDADVAEPCKFCKGTGIDPEIAAAIKVRDEEITRLRKIIAELVRTSRLPDPLSH